MPIPGVLAPCPPKGARIRKILACELFLEMYKLPEGIGNRTLQIKDKNLLNNIKTITGMIKNKLSK